MKPRVREVIVVEGRYDRNTLLQAVDAAVVEVGGFTLFRDREKVAYLRALAEKRGIILLTDADSAGFVIRNHLKGCLPPERVKQAYIPDVYGKDRTALEHRFRMRSAPPSLPRILPVSVRNSSANARTGQTVISSVSSSMTRTRHLPCSLRWRPPAAFRRSSANFASVDDVDRLPGQKCLHILHGLLQNPDAALLRRP